MTLEELVSSPASGGVALTQANRLLANQTSGYNLQVVMDIDAITGPSASLSDIDFSFGAVATT